MASWWRLRTQAYLVLGVLLVLIVFLGAYALSEARRHADEADKLLGANFAAASIVKRIETARAEQLATAAKFRVTRDAAYRDLSLRQHEKISEELQKLRTAIGDDHSLAPAFEALVAARKLENGIDGRAVPAFGQALKDLDRSLEAQRTERAKNLRVVARELGKTIFVTFLVAVGVTSWLGLMLYHALLKPLEKIKEATGRIREGELSHRIERFHGFQELDELRSEFNEMAAKLEELDRMKADFLSTVSHELRTPLTALKEGLVFMTEKQGSLPPHLAARTLEVCNQAAKRLETMIQNLLNHAKMESGFYSFDERPKDFAATVRDAILGIKPIAERRGMSIELNLRVDKPLASYSSEGITHALENLLLNAIKYGDASHPIEVEVLKRDHPVVPQIEVRVSNHGKSLLPSELTQVFERFFRASNADGQKGVGLGLSVVKRIIEAHHGTVEAESAEGVTTFWFRIPQRYESVGKLRALTEVLA